MQRKTGSLEPLMASMALLILVAALTVRRSRPATARR